MKIRYIYGKGTQEKYLTADGQFVIRNLKGPLKGAVVFGPDGKIGYSFVHKTDRSKVSKDLVRRVAVGRLNTCALEPGTKDWKKTRKGKVQGKQATVPHEVLRVIRWEIQTKALLEGRTQAQGVPPGVGIGGRE